MNQFFSVEFAAGIVGSEGTDIKSHPYQVSIRLTPDSNLRCSGVIISKDYVVTIGDCYHNPEFINITVAAGTENAGGFGGSLHRIEKFIRHENFSNDLMNPPVNNIAVIKVDPPFEFDETRRPIELFRSGEEVKPGAVAVVSGWGKDFEDPQHPYPYWLRKAEVSVISKDVCCEGYKQALGFNITTHICTESFLVGRKGPCFRDEGGPLVIDGKLAGIISTGRSCSQIEDPALYVKVAYYRDWIRKNTNV